MPTAKRAPARLKKPEQISFQEVSGADASKFDRSAVWTAHAEQHVCGGHHLSPGFQRRLARMAARLLGFSNSLQRFHVDL